MADDRDGNGSFWAQFGPGPGAAEHDKTWWRHLAAVDGYVQAWIGGKLTLEEKRRAISAENISYHGGGCPARLRWPPSSAVKS